MDLPTFLRQRRPEWKRLEDVLERVEGSGLAALDDDQAVEFGRLYRRAASDLNQAHTYASGDATVRFLNDLVARAYLVIHGRRKADLLGLLRYILLGFPVVFRRNLRPLLLATILFSAGTAVGFLASYFDSTMARIYLLPRDFPTIQPDEDGEQHDTPAASSGTLTAFSSFLFTNNLRVSLFIFALGITFGIGTAWLLFSNGIMTGALWAVFVEANQLTAFATGILPHGVVEIPAVLIAGGAGFILAKGMIRARTWPRVEELTRCGIEALFLVVGCVPLLVAAAFIEAVIARAPDSYIGSGLKLAVAGVVGTTFVLYLLLVGKKGPTTSSNGLVCGSTS